jgi:hypothetical protein
MQMNQILHILRKDTRRHWPEIGSSVLLLATFVWREPRQWGIEQGTRYASEYLLQFIGPLLVISWGFLILRVVHEESLVGDRQFWVTRPYEWEKLLASKVLFLVVFVNVPMLIAQLVLLKVAHFEIFPNLVNVLQVQLANWTFLIIAIVLAVITRGLAQAVLVGIGATLAAIAAGVLISQIPGSSMSPVVPMWDAVEGWLYLLVGLSVILGQYARRNTWPSRLFLLATAALVLVIQLVTPYNKLIGDEYPRRDESQQPVKVAFAITQPWERTASTRGWPLPEWPIQVPLSLSGIASDHVVKIRGFRVVIEMPGDIPWNSGWQAGGPELWPDENLSYVNFQIKSELYDRLKATPLKLRMTLALTEIMETNVQEIVIGEGEFAVPNVGTCFNRLSMPWIQCRAAVRRPGVMASVAGTTESCSQASSERSPVSGATLHTLLWAPTPDVNPGISPVQAFGLNFSASNGLITRPEDRRRIVICPGTRMRLGKPKIVGHSRIEFETPEIRLEEYRVAF